MPPDRVAEPAAGEPPPRRQFVWPGLRPFSPLTRRILAVNLLALGLLVAGLLFLGQYKQSLIRAEIEALKVQAETIANAVSETAVVLGPASGEQLRVRRARLLMRRLVEPMRSRARLFDLDGHLIGDTSLLPGVGGAVYAEELPPVTDNWLTQAIKSAYDTVATLPLFSQDLPLYVERPEQHARDYEEVMQALRGEPASAVRQGTRGGMVLSVAVPIQRYKQVVGAVMLSTTSREVEEALREVRIGILQVFAVVFAVTVALSLYLASTIVRPIRHLAAAAKRVRHGYGRRRVIPDYSDRDDEIGDLSTDLRTMTEGLWNRMDAIEQFAADVAHELKNPLSSLRSAVETIAHIKDEERRARLLKIIVDDVTRLDRIISDISDASRVDAEMSRAQFEPVSLVETLKALAELHNVAAKPGNAVIRLDLPEGDPLEIRGFPGRLVQVFRNLLDNAASFSPRGGTIRVAARRAGAYVVVTVDDDGPGIPEGMEEQIFQRFYSERPEDEQFGTHSGLGLSISRQIVTVHGGTITAENRRDGEGRVLGARFTVRLPQNARGPER